MTLHVEGVDPTRIECMNHPGGIQTVKLKGGSTWARVAYVNPNTGVVFDGSWHDDFRADAQAVMNAAIDHWRLTGRLFPEPKVEPVACVCGAKPWVGTPSGVYCESGLCCLRANTVAQWNIIQAALKGAK